MKILVIDIGGTHIKALATGRRKKISVDSHPDLAPAEMAAKIKAATAGWKYDAVTIGYPGPVRRGRIIKEPAHLGRGWMTFNFTRAFGKPVRILNDAAMQALGSYRGGSMLFLGLGTGLGSALIVDGVLAPLELAHLPYKDNDSYEHFVGIAGLKRMGKRKWRRHVHRVVAQLRAAMQADYVVLGGGNARLISKLPPAAELGGNVNAFRGGFRLWKA